MPSSAQRPPSAGPACPAFDQVVGMQNTTYDPNAVNWKGVIADIKAVGQAEPRFCTFAIRTHFHDAAAVGTKPEPFVAQDTVVGGSDGSIMTDIDTLTLSNHQNYGMAAFTRQIIVPIAVAHNASIVDVLSVSAAACTEVMGSPVNIAKTCSAAGLPFYVRACSWHGAPCLGFVVLESLEPRSPFSWVELLSKPWVIQY
jgi:hypothetical protein